MLGPGRPVFVVFGSSIVQFSFRNHEDFRTKRHLSTPPVNVEQIHKILGITSRTNEGSQVYSEACIKLCQELGIQCVYLWTAFRQRDDWMTTCFTDGIHFSSEGSKLVAKEILKAMEEADWEPSLCCNSLPTEFDQDSVYDLVGRDGKSINVSDP
ncbi:GDSL esterase/lipase CPRD49-like [Hibiscus syriacus]|uniref:GDSL esterase/lipase CPRD49-like n=1 Tax=Hibiscus syriacus TaxID=106335 RepID=UPI001924F0F9|nr:GDSL esterase/lipase CPRD49-like [Hibiscus syriacus]